MNVQEQIKLAIRAINGEREAAAQQVVRKTIQDILKQQQIIKDASAEIVRLTGTLKEVKAETIAEDSIQVG